MDKTDKLMKKVPLIVLGLFSCSIIIDLIGMFFFDWYNEIEKVQTLLKQYMFFSFVFILGVVRMNQMYWFERNKRVR